MDLEGLAWAFEKAQRPKQKLEDFDFVQPLEVAGFYHEGKTEEGKLYLTASDEIPGIDEVEDAEDALLALRSHVLTVFVVDHTGKMIPHGRLVSLMKLPHCGGAINLYVSKNVSLQVHMLRNYVDQIIDPIA